MVSRSSSWAGPVRRSARDHVSPVLAYADGLDSPRSPPEAVIAAAGLAGDDIEVLLGWTPEPRAWLASGGLRGRTIMAGYALSRAIAAGRLRYLPVRLSAMPRLLADGLRPEVAVVTGIRRGSSLAFGASAGWGPAAALAAERVVVEVDESGRDLGGPPIPGNVVATIQRPALTDPPPVPRAPSDVDRQIAAHVVRLLPEEPTLQLGPGGVAEAIVAALDRPVRIWSGLVTDGLWELDRRGLLRGRAVAAYVWGGREVAPLAETGKLDLLPIERTHDVTHVSAIERFVGCNTAVQVGLDGTVNVERAAGRLVAGIGGHADFCMAASRSVGGISIIAVASTTKAGVSTIVPRVETPSTPRCDVEVIVTEHGIADLRGVDDEERLRRVIRVAAPEHRARLEGSTSAVRST